jgi:hypothetical protein
MADLLGLWLPIVAAAIAVFVASSLVHMVFKWHNGDYGKLSGDDELQAALRKAGATRGQYMVPHCPDMKTAQSEEMKARYIAGPIAAITVFPSGVPNMGPMLGKWFVQNLVFAAIAAAIALQIYGRGDHGHQAGHLAGLVTALAYGGGSVGQGVWMGKPWRVVALDLLDALIYGTVTALVFWKLWS